MAADDTTPKLHIDSDWKAEAQAEKERLAEAEAKLEADRDPGTPGPGEMPEASFRTLLGMLASQALMGLGTMMDRENKGVVVDLEGSKFSIDLLGILEEKTKGNLADDEAKELTQVLADLRARFVQITHLVAQQAMAGDGGSGGVPTITPE